MEINELKTKVGRRKTSVARVTLKEGKGVVIINKRAMEDYFRGCERYQREVTSPVMLVQDGVKFDYSVNVNGGGISSQAGAIRHSIARALSLLSDDNRAVLKKAGFLTRDDRMVERKKPGQPKARKRFQFSKR